MLSLIINLIIMKNKLFIILVLLVSVVGNTFANNLKQARDLYLDGKYKEALPLFEKEYKKKKRDGSINHWLGVCLFETGNYKEAEKYLKYADTRKVVESSHYLAKIYLYNYDFEQSLEMYDRYEELLEKSKKEMPQTAIDELDRLKTAKLMFEHVEKIAVIDSIVVDKESFFKHYRISPESGSLVSSTSLPISVDKNTVGYLTQNEDKVMWAMPDENGMLRIAESSRLIDGKWDTPQFLSEELNNEGDANYPYMMQDGATLYYASNGKGSIGGYDIFMTRVDTETGEYFKPQNVGMPYNSLADDYLLVLDDISGIGWWATDRNNIPDKLTIYVFVRNDIRQNYDIEQPDLVSYAQLLNYRKTWGDKDYNSLRTSLYNISTNSSMNEDEFIFCIKKGTIYTSIDDFKSKEAADKMEELIKLYGKHNSTKSNLSRKRMHYSLVNDDMKNVLTTEMLDLEKELQSLKMDIFNLENSIRKLELNK